MVTLSRRTLLSLTASILPFLSFSSGATAASALSSYVSPTYGYLLTFDPADWWVTTDFTNNGYDLFILTNGTSDVVLEGAPTAQFDGEACVYDELMRLSEREDVADLALSFEQSAWAGDFAGYLLSYTYLQHADTTEVRGAAGIKWCGLLGKTASLVVTQISPQAAMATQSAVVANLLHGLGT